MSSASEVVFMFDADALGQIFISGQASLLDHLRTKFGVRSFLMSEVEVELLSNRRISGLIRPLFQKAIKNGWLKVLSASDLEEISEKQETEVTLQAIRSLASDLKLLVQNGEAHTHAAAILLGCPSVSNDFQAIRVLEANDKPLPRTILRSFDLFGFFYQEHIIDTSTVESIRKVLIGHSEWVPAVMKHATFVDGFRGLQCRLSTSLSATNSSAGWSSTFYLPRLTKP